MDKAWDQAWRQEKIGDLRGMGDRGVGGLGFELRILGRRRDEDLVSELKARRREQLLLQQE